MEKSKLLDRLGADGEERLLAARVLDRMAQARTRNVPVSTDFLSPRQQVLCGEALRLAGMPENGWTALGGYDGAERKVLVFLPDWMEPEDAPAQSPLRCLRAAFRQEDGLTHRDLLGSLTGLGIAREKVGDILVGAESADLIVLESVAEFLIQSWESAGRARLRVTPLEPDALHIPAERFQEVRDTVSALRLDAVSAAGFRTARGKAADLIRSGHVQVNWLECVKPDRLLAPGDTVSARGLGKFQLTEAGSATKKGRIPVVLKRYV